MICKDFGTGPEKDNKPTHAGVGRFKKSPIVRETLDFIINHERMDGKQ